MHLNLDDDEQSNASTSGRTIGIDHATNDDQDLGDDLSNAGTWESDDRFSNADTDTETLPLEEDAEDHMDIDGDTI
jgi:hypothetical protein